MSTASACSFKDRLRVNSEEKLSKGIYGAVRGEVLELVQELFVYIEDPLPKSVTTVASLWDGVKFPAKSKIGKVGKNNLADFVEKACRLLVERCYPALDNLYSDVEEGERRIMQTQQDLIVAQKSLVEAQNRLVKLQCQLLEKRDEEITAVQDTARQEIKTFASVLEKGCESALAPTRIRTAISTASATEERMCNLMVYGLDDKEEEEKENNLSDKLVSLSTDLGVDIVRETKTFHRLGKFAVGSCRPVKVVFKTMETKNKVMARKSCLRNSEDFSKVYLSPDRTPEERTARRVLVDELKRMRAANPNTDFVITRGEVWDLDDLNGT